MEFIIKYWAQLAVLITAIGYALKGFWDFRVKKLEIKYNLLFKERLESISNFFLLFKQCENSHRELVQQIIDGNLDTEKYNTVYQEYEKFEKVYYYVTLLIPPKQKKYFDALDDLLSELQTLYFNSMNKNADMYVINDRFNDIQIESQTHLNNIRFYLQKEFKIK